MRTYNERMENIRAKAKANQKAKRILAVASVVMTVLILAIGSVILWPEMMLGFANDPTMGPVLGQPSVTTTPETAKNTVPFATTPTVPAPTGTEVSKPSNPDDKVGFEATAVKCHSGSGWGWGPVVIRSKAELELLYERVSGEFKDCGLEFEPIASVREQINQYDDAFFEKQSLILLMKPEGSGSNLLEVAEVLCDGNAVYVTIDRTVPEIGTCDMAYWYLFIETDVALAEETKVFIEYRINAEQLQEPVGKYAQIAFETNSIYYGGPQTDGKYPRVDVIRSVGELQMYLSAMEDDISGQTVKYDEAFFDSHTLLALWNTPGSSSEKYNVTQVWRMSDGSVLIGGEAYKPELFDDDMMSWLIFIEAEEEISHYAGITVEYETIQAATAPDRPENTNLEFWIGQDVGNVDFSEYDEIYGWFGAQEYLGKGYRTAWVDDVQQYPEEYVSFVVGAFPDEADGGRYVTQIEITDADVSVYGLTIQSDEAQFDAIFRAMGYGIYENNGTWSAEKNGITFRFRPGEYLRITAKVTNREGIIY